MYDIKNVGLGLNYLTSEMVLLEVLAHEKIL